VGREGIYFCGEDWTTQISLIWLGKLDFGRSGFCEAGRERVKADDRLMSIQDLGAVGIA
jgi:hypothetical protein